MIATILGGLGLFLLGMVLMTDGLKATAGDALRGILLRFVSGPVTGVASGAAMTAIVQSSAATTVTVIGFVSAGLLTFTQSVGVIFGANLGTTSTGWIVSQLGFKVSLGAIAPPIVLVGVVLRLIGRGRWTHAGVALAGFGLLFIGIDMLQGGMGSLAGRVSPADLPGDGWLGRLALVGIGAAMTVVMQSSSAAMATTLAAVASGSINLEQAAALVIGQNVGTTVAATVASLGATAAAKRTALAHVLFNVFTGAVAFFMLPLILHGLLQWLHLKESGAPTSLAAFHSAFNMLGIAILLPLVRPFSGLIERIIPDRTPRPTRYLGKAVAELGPVAQEAARRSLIEVLHDAAGAALRVLRQERLDERARTAGRVSVDAISEVRRFLHDLSRAQQSEQEVERNAALLHAADHLDRLLDAVTEPPDRRGLEAQRTGGPLASIAAPLRELLEQIAGAELPSPEESAPTPRAEGAEQTSLYLARQRKSERLNILAAAAAGRLDPDDAAARIDALLWLDRVAYHLWRASHYLTEPPPKIGAAEPPPTAADA